MKIKLLILSTSIIVTYNLAYAKHKGLNIKETQICRQVSKLQFPKNDLPTAKDVANLQGCNARNLYYGINTPINYANARKCALIDFLALSNQEDDFDLFSPNNILVMIYANGKGVQRNVDLATKVACSTYNADSKLGLDIKYLQKLKKEPLAKYNYDIYYDFCKNNKADLIWEKNNDIYDEGEQAWQDLPGICQDLANSLQSSTVKQITKKYSLAQKKQIENLLQNFSDFADQQVGIEIHGTDSGGTTEYVTNMSIYADDQTIALKGKLVDALSQFEQGKFPSGSEQDYKNSIVQLNSLNQKAKLSFNKYQKSDSPINFDWNDEIKIQKQWSQWSKEFIKFANTRYPKVPSYIWNLWLTQQRIEQIKDFIDSLENPQ